MSPLRPIAPVEMVRPKRLRPDSNHHATDSHSPISSDYQAEDDAYDAPPPSPQPRRRGRKPGTLSRAAREAQRKTNHSLIEKARRTKINDALATLRELVPPEYKRANEAPERTDDDEEEEPKKGKGKSKAGEKEFKLEILVRTVAYLQDLTEKVKQLEENGCPNCKHSICPSSSSYGGRSSKRRRQDVESNQTEEEESARADVAPPDDQPSRLPSISTWLPPSSQQRSLLLTPSLSPSTLRATTSSKPASLQLPTPPTSVTFTPSSSVFGVPPVLTLPSPSTFLPPSGAQIQPCFSGFMSRRTPSDASSSPMYSPEDETAASLLLRISASASTTSSQSPLKQAPSLSEPQEEQPREEYVHALTPSRLLGLIAGK